MELRTAECHGNKNLNPGLTKWNGDLSRRYVPNRRGGVPFHVTGAQLGEKEPRGVAFMLITDKAGSSGITPIQERTGQLKRWTGRGFWGKGQGACLW